MQVAEADAKKRVEREAAEAERKDQRRRDLQARLGPRTEARDRADSPRRPSRNADAPRVRELPTYTREQIAADRYDPSADDAPTSSAPMRNGAAAALGPSSQGTLPGSQGPATSLSPTPAPQRSASPSPSPAKLQVESDSCHIHESVLSGCI